MVIFFKFHHYKKGHLLLIIKNEVIKTLNIVLLNESGYILTLDLDSADPDQLASDEAI